MCNVNLATVDFHTVAHRAPCCIVAISCPWMQCNGVRDLTSGGMTRGVFMRRSAPPIPEQQLGVGNGASGRVSPAHMPKDPPIAHPRMCRAWEVRRG